MLGVLNRHISAVTSNAYISTLGGGYFLCDMLKRARHAASAQLRVALGMGDLGLAGRCVMHMVYADIKEAKYHAAKHKLHTVRHTAHQIKVLLPRGLLHARASHSLPSLQDGTLMGMTEAADIMIAKLEEVGQLPAAHPTRDDFSRLRARRVA